MKKKLALALALMMAAMPAFTGCGKGDGGSKGSGDSSKVVILYPGEETDKMSNFINNELNPRLEKEAGINVEIIYKGWDQYWEQKDIMLSSNTPIDLYWDGLPDLATMVNKSQCQPLDDLIEKYGKDMKKVIPDSQLEGGKVNGVQYGIPSAYAPSSGMFQLVCVREDILEDVGMDKIETADDLKKFATLSKEKHPELNGPADTIFKPLTRYFADEQYTWCALADTVVYGEDTHKAYSYFETDAFQQLAKFNQSMYADGLYQDECTTNFNERDSRMQQGTYLWVEGSLGKENEITSAVRANAPDAVLKSYLMAPEKKKYITACGGEVLCVPESAENPEGAIKFLNWLYSSKDNYMFALYGPEGENYTVENDRIVLKDPAFEGYFYEWMFRNKNYTMFNKEVPDEFIETYEHWDDDAIVSDVIGFHFDNSNVKEIEASINEVCNQYLLPIECGFVDFDEEYPKAIQALKDAGIDEYVAEVQKQLDEYFKENGHQHD